ncbi:MAG: hypothetical protein GY817_08925 [bacterium]|nr:hypothetical protein [bacterium]
MLLCSEKHPDIFLFILTEKEVVNLAKIKEKIKAIKDRNLSSVIAIILPYYDLKDSLSGLGVQRFFTFEEKEKLKDWTSILARHLH